MLKYENFTKIMMDYKNLTNQLKPCAHCGRIINELNIFYENFGAGDEYLIECDCGIGSVNFDKIEIIIENWNKRDNEYSKIKKCKNC